MWGRWLSEVQTEHQNGEERGFKWLWTWNGCWCQTGWSEYFTNCWSEDWKTLPGLMSLDFCCYIQMLESEFGVKTMKAWIILPCLNGSGCWWWCNVWGIFSWHTLGPLVPIEHRLNATAYLSIVADHVHPFMTTVHLSSDGYFSRIMHHVTKLKSSQTGFLSMTMSSLYSNGLHSHQISIQ